MGSPIRALWAVVRRPGRFSRPIAYAPKPAGRLYGRSSPDPRQRDVGEFVTFAPGRSAWWVPSPLDFA